MNEGSIEQNGGGALIALYEELRLHETKAQGTGASTTLPKPASLLLDDSCCGLAV